MLTKTESGWAQPLDGHASTHILKPQLPDALSSVIYDEEFGTRIGRSLGLTTFSSEITVFDGVTALVIERYDRSAGDRVHQEDFNQVLGASGNEKYQEYGGLVTLAHMAETLRRSTNEDDVETLARTVTLAVALGNLDMHAKNVSILHPSEAPPRLAPAYDVVPHAHQGDGRLALAVAGEYRHAAMNRALLIAEFEAWGIRRADALVNGTLERIVQALTHEHPLDGARPGLHSELSDMARRLLEGKAIGATA